MKKMFKSKKTRKYKFLIFVLGIFLSTFISNKIISNISKNYIISGKLEKFDINIDKEKMLLKLGLNYKKINKVKKNSSPVFNELIFDNPKIYVYNTHNKENYASGSVIDASIALKNKLESKNIDVIVEDKDIVSEVKKNNLQYKDTYKVTRDLLINKMSEEFSIYIDLHRDSVSKDATTTEIDGKSYAKILFVIGGKHESYMENYSVCDKLNKYIKNINNKLTRGILVRKSSSYNQDLASNIILIELGSENNTMEEVNNTIEVLSEAISYYVNE